MASEDMAALSLKARGRPVRIDTRRSGTIDTFGVPYRERVGGDGVRRLDKTLSIPASVPVVEQDMAMYAGRDYVVRAVDADGSHLKRIGLQNA